MQARLRAERELLVALTEHPEQATHLYERLLARRFDRIERLPGLFRSVRERPPASACLQDDDTDRVGDHVAELSRDPPPLLCDGRAGNSAIRST
jgi:hypothetical protein